MGIFAGAVVISVIIGPIFYFPLRNLKKKEGNASFDHHTSSETWQIFAR
jgi:hypothetical protein